MKSDYYWLTIGNGYGVFYVQTTDARRVRHEIDNLPDRWHINIWLFDGTDTPLRKCDVSEF